MREAKDTPVNQRGSTLDRDEKLHLSESLPDNVGETLCRLWFAWLLAPQDTFLFPFASQVEVPLQVVCMRLQCGRA